MAWWTAVVSVAIATAFGAIVVWLTFQRSCCSLRVASTNRLYKEAKRDVSLAAWEWHDANDLSTSPWFGTRGRMVVLCYRVFLALYFIATMILEATVGGSMANWATYFTNWTFVGLAVHACVGIAQSLHGMRRGDCRPEQPGWARQPYRWHDVVHAMVACTIITMAMHVTIFYWVGLMPDDIYADSILKHGINALVLQVELAISSLPITTTWLFFPTAYTLAYAIFMWIWHAIDDSWVYPKLSYHKDLSPVLYLIVSLLVLVPFAVSFFVAWLREKIAARREDGESQQGSAHSVVPDTVAKGDLESGSGSPMRKW
eukprot:jgi/Ulvmu1/1481/UM011_0211.1